MNTEKSSYLSKLGRLINTHFNLDEIQSLCLALGMDYEHLEGGAKLSKIRSLLLYLARRDELERLVVLLKEERMSVVWPDTPDEVTLQREIDVMQAKQSENITIHGDVGPGGAIGHGASVKADNIAGRDVNIGTDIHAVTNAFATIYKAINAKKFESEEVRQEVVSAVKSIETQNEKGETANKSLLDLKFRTLALMAPDIWEVVTSTLASPVQGVRTVVKKIATKAQEQMKTKNESNLG